MAWYNFWKAAPTAAMQHRAAESILRPAGAAAASRAPAPRSWHRKKDINRQKMIETARFLAERDPAAAFAIDAGLAFLVGDGFRYQIEDEQLVQDRSIVAKAKALWDHFWRRGGQDSLASRLQYDIAASLLIDGEVCLTRRVQPGTMQYIIDAIDPFLIDGVDSDPSIGVRYSTVRVGASGGSPIELAVIRQVDNDIYASAYRAWLGATFEQRRRAKYTAAETVDDLAATTEHEIDITGGDGGGKRVGDVIYWTIGNRGLHDLRGQSILFPAFDLLVDSPNAGQASIYTLFYELMQLVGLHAQHAVTHVTDAANVQRVQEQWDRGELKLGRSSVTVLSKGDELRFSGVEIGAADFDSLVSNLMRYLSLAIGMPPHWLGFSQDVNRAASENMDVPALKIANTRQQRLAELFTEIFEDYLDNVCRPGVRVGKLSASLTDSDVAAIRALGYQIVGPALSKKDSARGAKTFAETVRAVMIARNSDDLSADAAAEIIAKAAQDAFGIDISGAALSAARGAAERVIRDRTEPASIFAAAR